MNVSANLEVLRPSKRQWKPRLRQAALTLPASGGQRGGKMTMKHEIEKNDIKSR